MKLEPLNTLVIDMTQENDNKFRINGQPIDMSQMESLDIHIERQTAIIKTVEKRIMSFGDRK